MLKQIEPLYKWGFSLIWLRPRSKRPVEKSWTKNEKKDWKHLRDTYAPKLNVGVRLGEMSQLEDGTFLAVIDCDVKSADKVHLKEMEKALDTFSFDWKNAPTVASGRGQGSRHIYVRTKEPARAIRIARSNHVVKAFMPSAAPSEREKDTLTPDEIEKGMRLRAAWEISLMGTGQQTVLPPSVHPDTGKEYRWVKEIDKIKSLPLATIKAPEGHSPMRLVKDAPEFSAIEVDLTASGLSDEIVDLIASCSNLDKYGGDRSAALFAATLAMISDGFTDQEIMAVLTDPDFELSRAAYEHTQSRNRATAAKWVYKYTIKKARDEKSGAKAFEDMTDIETRKLEPHEIEAQEQEMKGPWEDELEINYNTRKPKPTLRNTMLVLENYTDKKLFVFDEFYHGEFYASEPPWKDRRGKWTGRELVDADLGRIKAWLSDKFGFEPSTDHIMSAIAVVARRNTRHPVREYLEGLEWDGTKRLDSWLSYYMRAEGPEEYLSAVGRKLLVAAVARVMKPGCKFDHVTIFEGKQGIGKSTACSILGGGWFSDTLGDITSKDVVDNMRGKWILEIGELASMRRADVESLKHFITVQRDNVRKAYAKRSETYARQCVFIGTTNRNDYLKDETGNRRFWPVKVRRARLAELQRDRAQLWAEAKFLFAEGEPLYLESKRVERIARIEQSNRLEFDDWTDVIGEILKGEAYSGEKGFKLLELWKDFAKSSDLDGSKLSVSNQQRLGRCLRGMGYERKLVRDGDEVSRNWTRASFL